MRRVLLSDYEQLVVEEVPEPECGQGEVVVDVVLCGVCGSDLHAYHGEHAFIHPPIVLGHEFTGVVSRVGADVQGLAVGDRVVVEPSLVCGGCYNCRSGRYNVCENLRVIGCQATGAFAEKIAVPAAKVIRIPDSMSFSQAVLLEPLAVGVHAVERSGMRRGDKVLIFGAGPIGLMVLAAAKAAAAGKIVVLDLQPSRLAAAEKVGADVAANAGEVDDLEAFVIREFGSNRHDLGFECAASEQALNGAIDTARRGTSIIVVGCFGQRTCINNMSFLQEHELSLIGSMMYMRPDWDRAVELVQEKLVPEDVFITHRFPLEQAAEAFKFIDSHRPEVIKCVLEVQKGK